MSNQDESNIKVNEVQCSRKKLLFPSNSSLSSSSLTDTENNNKPTNSLLPNEDKIRKYLIKENKEYEQKISLGKIVYKLVREENINQESLDFVYKEALDLFMKQKQHID